jgi:hypothetical protein
MKLFLFGRHHIYDFTSMLVYLSVKFKYGGSKVKINQIVIIYF